MQRPLARLMPALLFCLSVAGQTTQGLLSGRISDSINGRPVAGAEVVCFNPALSFTASTHTDNSGYYYLAQLSPGVYQVRLTAAAIQHRRGRGQAQNAAAEHRYR